MFYILGLTIVVSIMGGAQKEKIIKTQSIKIEKLKNQIKTLKKAV
jgi:hypothetical protein